WQAHIGGLAGGILAGWVFRERRLPAAGAVVPAAAGTGKPGTEATRSGATPRKPGKTGTIASDNPRARLPKQLDHLSPYATSHHAASPGALRNPAAGPPGGLPNPAAAIRAGCQPARCGILRVGRPDPLRAPAG